MIRSLLVLLLFAAMGYAAPASTSGESSGTAADSTVRWFKYSDALKIAKIQKKLIFVDLYADWCVPCRVMDVNVYRDPRVVKLLNERFLPVKLDADSQEKILCDGKKKTVQRCYYDVWELKALPALVLVAPKGMSILTVTQSMSADEMEYLLNQFLSKEQEWIVR